VGSRTSPPTRRCSRSSMSGLVKFPVFLGPAAKCWNNSAKDPACLQMSEGPRLYPRETDVIGTREAVHVSYMSHAAAWARGGIAAGARTVRAQKKNKSCRSVIFIPFFDTTAPQSPACLRVPLLQPRILRSGTNLPRTLADSVETFVTFTARDHRPTVVSQSAPVE